MGIGILHDDSFDDVSSERVNPDPRKFKVLDVTEANGNIVAVVRYLGVEGFERVKVLMYRNMSASEFRNLTLIDPHFSRTLASPFARFDPTIAGFSSAILFALGPQIPNDRRPINLCSACNCIGVMNNDDSQVCADCEMESK